jgi:hypothetical protein
MHLSAPRGQVERKSSPDFWHHVCIKIFTGKTAKLVFWPLLNLEKFLTIGTFLGEQGTKVQR